MGDRINYRFTKYVLIHSIKEKIYLSACFVRDFLLGSVISTVGNGEGTLTPYSVGRDTAGLTAAVNTMRKP